MRTGRNPIDGFPWTVVALCGALLIVYGYDVFVVGTVLPTLIVGWDLTKPKSFALQTWVLILGPLADRIGRKKGAAIRSVLSTTATTATGFMNTPG